jgi:predicted nuclease of predicted toxin-antitoxin system
VKFLIDAQLPPSLARVLVQAGHDVIQTVTYLLKREPSKFLLVTTGNISNQSLFKLFEKNLSNICSLLSESAVVEMNKENLIVHFYF